MSRHSRADGSAASRRSRRRVEEPSITEWLDSASYGPYAADSNRSRSGESVSSELPPPYEPSAPPAGEPAYGASWFGTGSADASTYGGSYEAASPSSYPYAESPAGSADVSTYGGSYGGAQASSGGSGAYGTGSAELLPPAYDDSHRPTGSTASASADADPSSYGGPSGYGQIPPPSYARPSGPAYPDTQPVQGSPGAEPSYRPRSPAHRTGTSSGSHRASEVDTDDLAPPSTSDSMASRPFLAPPAYERPADRYPSIPAVADTGRYPSAPPVTDTGRYPSAPAVADTGRYPSAPPVADAGRYPSAPAVADAGRYPSIPAVADTSRPAPGGYGLRAADPPMADYLTRPARSDPAVPVRRPTTPIPSAARSRRAPKEPPLPPANPAGRLRLRVNPIACDGHGLCAELLPEIVSLDDWGYPMPVVAEIPAELEPHAQRAAQQCPTLAIILERRQPRSTT